MVNHVPYDGEFAIAVHGQPVATIDYLQTLNVVELGIKIFKNGQLRDHMLVNLPLADVAATWPAIVADDCSAFVKVYLEDVTIHTVGEDRQLMTATAVGLRRAGAAVDGL